MFRGIFAVFLFLIVATGVAHSQARDKNFGNVFKKFGQQFKQDLRRGTEGLRRPANQPPKLASQTHELGTCFVYSNVGAEVDRERCNRVEECDVTGTCVARHIWPSGSETIVQSQNGQLRFINGSSVAEVNMYGRPCLRNNATANIFCFVKEQAAPEVVDRNAPPPAGTKIDPPKDVARNLLADLFGSNKSQPNQNNKTPSQFLPFGTADLPAVGWHYYAGEQKCDAFVRKVHLQLQVFDENRSAGRLSHKEVRLDGSFGQRSPTEHVVREIKAASVGDKVFFASDRREMSGLFLGDDQNEFKGEWLARGLERGNCKALVLKRTDHPKIIFQKLAKTLNNKRASVQEAEQLAALIMAAPDWSLSTDGEGRPSVSNWANRGQFQTSYLNFWRGFHQRQNAIFADLNLSNERLYSIYAEDIRKAIALSEAFSGWDRDHVNFAFPLEQRLADAAAILEGEAEPVTIPSVQRACERMLTGGKSGRDINIEYVVGLPFEYWTQSSKSKFVSFARNCAELYGQFQRRYSTIAREISNMDVQSIAAWQDGQWLIAKAKAANAQKPGLAALRQTSGFEITQKELRDRRIKNAQYQRLYLPRVAEIKERSLSVASKDMRSYFDRQTINTLYPIHAVVTCERVVLKNIVRPETFGDPRSDVEKTLLAACQGIAKKWGEKVAIDAAVAQASQLRILPATFEALREHNWFAYDPALHSRFDYGQKQLALARFEQEIRSHRRLAIVDAQQQIRDAVNEAVSDSPIAPKFPALCNLDSSALEDIRIFCGAEAKRLTERINGFRCERAISDSGIRESQKKLRVRLDSNGRVMLLGNLICQGGINRPELTVSFKQGGIFVTPNIRVVATSGAVIADLDLRLSTPRDGRGFGKLLADIASGENEREVQETYVLERINYVDAAYRARNFSDSVGCVLGLSNC